MTHTAVVQLFAYDEPYLKPTLDAYAETKQPPGWVIYYEVGVTPKDGRTLREVERHPTFTAHKTPPGKLSSRNELHNKAAEDTIDVIISGDADSAPDSRNYLVKMLEPFEDTDVVGVNAFQQAHGITRPILMGGYWADFAVNRPFYGRGSAFRTEAWRQAGPFDTNLDQTSVNEVRGEEEFRFRRRLAQLGEVVDRTDARVQASGRRVMCMVLDSLRPFGHAEGGYCGRRGTETFAPDDRR